MVEIIWKTQTELIQELKADLDAQRIKLNTKLAFLTIERKSSLYRVTDAIESALECLLPHIDSYLYLLKGQKYHSLDMPLRLTEEVLVEVAFWYSKYRKIKKSDRKFYRLYISNEILVLSRMYLILKSGIITQSIPESFCSKYLSLNAELEKHGKKNPYKNIDEIPDYESIRKALSFPSFFAKLAHSRFYICNKKNNKLKKEIKDTYRMLCEGSHMSCISKVLNKSSDKGRAFEQIMINELGTIKFQINHFLETN